MKREETGILVYFRPPVTTLSASLRPGDCANLQRFRLVSPASAREAPLPGIGSRSRAHHIFCSALKLTQSAVSGGGGCGAVKFIISAVAAPRPLSNA
jgi:hypothetical protein